MDIRRSPLVVQAPFAMIETGQEGQFRGPLHLRQTPSSPGALGALGDEDRLGQESDSGILAMPKGRIEDGQTVGEGGIVGLHGRPPAGQGRGDVRGWFPAETVQRVPRQSGPGPDDPAPTTPLGLMAARFEEPLIVGQLDQVPVVATGRGTGVGACRLDPGSDGQSRSDVFRRLVGIVADNVVFDVDGQVTPSSVAGAPGPRPGAGGPVRPPGIRPGRPGDGRRSPGWHPRPSTPPLSPPAHGRPAGGRPPAPPGKESLRRPKTSRSKAIPVSASMVMNPEPARAVTGWRTSSCIFCGHRRAKYPLWGSTMGGPVVMSGGSHAPRRWLAALSCVPSRSTSGPRAAVTVAHDVRPMNLITVGIEPRPIRSERSTARFQAAAEPMPKSGLSLPNTTGDTMRRCTVCGLESDPNAVACVHCGGQLEPLAAASVPGPRDPSLSSGDAGFGAARLGDGDRRAAAVDAPPPDSARRQLRRRRFARRQLRRRPAPFLPEISRPAARSPPPATGGRPLRASSRRALRTPGRVGRLGSTRPRVSRRLRRSPPHLHRGRRSPPGLGGTRFTGRSGGFCRRHLPVGPGGPDGTIAGHAGRRPQVHRNPDRSTDRRRAGFVLSLAHNRHSLTATSAGCFACGILSARPWLPRS